MTIKYSNTNTIAFKSYFNRTAIVTDQVYRLKIFFIFFIGLKKEGTLQTTGGRSGATYYRDIHLPNGSHGSST